MTELEVHVTGGVDTHKDAHVAAALDQLGRTLGTESFPTTSAGYRQLLSWLTGFGTVDSVGIEGTGAWGAGLARFLTANDVAVIEVRRPNWQHRRRHGKSDPADAISAARAVQSGEEHGAANLANGSVEAIRLVLVARRSAIKARAHTHTANQIHAVIDTAPKNSGLGSTANPSTASFRRGTVPPQRRRLTPCGCEMCAAASCSTLAVPQRRDRRARRPPRPHHRPMNGRPQRLRDADRGGTPRRGRRQTATTSICCIVRVALRSRPTRRIIGSSATAPTQTAAGTAKPTPRSTSS